MENKRKYVIPGDLVTTGPFRPEQNVVLEGNKIISSSKKSQCISKGVNSRGD